MFKNYMHNELGISKEDIRMWIQECIEKQVEHKLKTINIEKIVANKVIRHMNENDTWAYHGSDPIHAIKREVAELLKNELVLTLKDKKDEM